MALGDFKLFQWKSKEQRDREQKEYEEWAFPHGQEQRDKLEALMCELCPKTQLPFLMMGYLTCKELYEKHLKKLESDEKALEYMINDESSYKQLIKKSEMTLYLALILAGKEIDEQCEYPPADEMQQRIQELDKLKRKKR